MGVAAASQPAEQLCCSVSPLALLQSHCAACSFSLRRRAAIASAHAAKRCEHPAAAVALISSSVKAAEGRQGCSGGSGPWRLSQALSSHLHFHLNHPENNSSCSLGTTKWPQKKKKKASVKKESQSFSMTASDCAFF